MKSILILVVLGVLTLGSFFYVIAQGSEDADTDSELQTNINALVNADTGAGVTTSMNGNTSAAGGVAISSTSASKESRNTSGSGE